MSTDRIEIVTAISFDQALLAIRKHIDIAEPGQLTVSDAELLEEGARAIRAKLEKVFTGAEPDQQFNCPPIAQQMKEKEAAIRESLKPFLPKPTPEEVYRRVKEAIESPWPDHLNDEGKRELHDVIMSGEATSERVLSGLGLRPTMFTPEAHQRIHYCLKQLYRELQ